MNDLGEATDALQSVLAQIDKLGHWAAAAHVSLALSMLYGVSGIDVKVPNDSAVSRHLSL
jgi:hypothetical protein